MRTGSGWYFSIYFFEAPAPKWGVFYIIKILCHIINSLIYINKAFREQFIKVLEDRMVHGGLLILGKTELLHNSKSSFKKIDSHHNMYSKNHTFL